MVVGLEFVHWLVRMLMSCSRSHPARRIAAPALVVGRESGRSCRRGSARARGGPKRQAPPSDGPGSVVLSAESLKVWKGRYARHRFSTQPPPGHAIRMQAFIGHGLRKTLVTERNSISAAELYTLFHACQPIGARGVRLCRTLARRTHQLSGSRTSGAATGSASTSCAPPSPSLEAVSLMTMNTAMTIRNTAKPRWRAA